MNKKLFVLLLILAMWVNSAFATTSTINPNVPAQNAPLTSLMFRSQFGAAFNDINALWAYVQGGISVSPGSVSGILGPANGGLGFGTVCGAGTYVGSSNGTTYSCITPAGTGTVTTSGSIVTGRLAKFSSATGITNAVAGTDYQIPVSLSTSGTSGAATFNSSTGVINIPVYSGGGGGTPGGLNGQLQYNSAGAFAGLTVGGSLSFTPSTALLTAPTTLSSFTNNLNFISAAGAPVQSVAGRTGTVTLTSTDVGLGNVANADTTNANNITSGKLATSQGGAGTSTGILKALAGVVSSATAGLDYSSGTSALATGIIKSTTSTGALTIAVAGDFPTLNQNTTGSAATLTTPRNINGVSFDGSGNITVPAAAGTLTGSTLASGVTASSLTSFGSAIALGTPASGVMTNVTGLPISTGVSGLGTGVATFLATPTSANLATAVTNETGSGPLVFASSPSISGATITTSTVNGVTLDATGSSSNCLTQAGTYAACSGGGGGSGTVTSFAFTSANGLGGTVANSTTTPTLTLNTTVTGVLKGNGTAISAASAGTDYQAPVTLTTTGTSGAATLVSNTLNIPKYASASLVGSAYNLYSTPILYSSSHLAYGDSVTCGYGAAGSAACSNLGYVNQLSTDEGAQTITNYGTPSLMACDQAYSYVFKYSNPAASKTNITTNMIGTNDAAQKGTGTYENVFNNCHQASLSWLSIPNTFKTFAQTCSVTGTWTNDTTLWFSSVGRLASTSSATMDCPITTYGGPIYVWYRQTDSSTVTFTYAVDGGATTAVSVATTPAIATVLGGTNGVGFIRIPGIAAGAHTVNLVETAGNSLMVAGVGTPPPYNYYNAPSVYNAGVIRQQNDANAAKTLAYDTDAQANVNLLYNDGLHVNFVPVRNYVNVTTDMYDSVHPNLTGHGHIRDAFAGAMQFEPFVPNITLTTTGTTGAATFTSGALNIPQYAGVSSVAFTSANGFGGTITNPTTTPSITLNTTVTGILKGNGTAMSAAAAGTDYANSGQNLGYFASTTSSQLAGVVSDETGVGSLVFSSAATLTGGTSVNGVTLVSTGSNTSFLAADGTYNVPGGGGGGTPGGSTGQLQFNSGGAFAGAVNAKITTQGDLNIVDYATPSVPSTPTTGATIFSNLSAVPHVAYMTSGGYAMELQDSFMTSHVAGYSFPIGATVAANLNSAAGTPLGTGTARTFATTNLATSVNRVAYQSAASSSSTGGYIGGLSMYSWRGNAAGLGGFYYVIRFIIDTPQTNQRAFCGVASIAATVGGSANPSAATNIIGVGTDTTGTNLSLMTNDGSGTATTTSLGANYPTNSAGAFYEFQAYAPPNASYVAWSLKRLDTAFFTSGVVTADLPANTVQLSTQCQLGTGAGSAAVTMALVSMMAVVPY